MQTFEIITILLGGVYAIGVVLTMDQLLTHEGMPGDLPETLWAIGFCLFWPILLAIGLTSTVLEWAINAKDRRG